MAIDFPNSPTVGQTFTVSSATWTFDGVKWTAGASVMPMNDNRIINGDMRIDQRNNGALGTTGGYTVDRWQAGVSVTGKFQWGRNRDALTPPVGFPYYLGFASTSAYTPPVGEIYSALQTIEADMVSDFAWGTASAQSVTLSFWVRANVTGTYGGAINNAAGTRSYPFTYSIPVVNTWTRIVITIPGDTAGTWVMSGNAASLNVAFDLGSGSTYRGSAGAWAAANYYGVTGSVSPVSTNGATFYLTGVKLEIGSVATPFNRQSLAKSMADCQRYFQWAAFNIQFFTTGGGQTYGHTLSFPTMRASPTASTTVADPNVAQAIGNNGGTAVDTLTPYGARLSMVAIAAAATYALGYRVSLSAEL